MIKIVSVRENPQYIEQTVEYFSKKWGIDRKFYVESVNNSINTKNGFPRWYLLMNDDEIIGGCGLIEDDFMVRKDYSPWLCGLYVEEHFRGRKLGKKLLDFVRIHAKFSGIDTIYICTDHVGYYEKYGWKFIGMEQSEFREMGRVYAAKTENFDFWTAIDELIRSSEIVIDRPKDSKHPKVDLIYPLDYGYLSDTSAMDGGGIDVWLGSLGEKSGCDAIICIVDLFKRDSEIKILIGCTETEKEIIMRFINDNDLMKGIIIRK